jgi:hypothetical protein
MYQMCQQTAEPADTKMCAYSACSTLFTSPPLSVLRRWRLRRSKRIHLSRTSSRNYEKQLALIPRRNNGWRRVRAKLGSGRDCCLGYYWRVLAEEIATRYRTLSPSHRVPGFILYNHGTAATVKMSRQPNYMPTSDLLAFFPFPFFMNLPNANLCPESPPGNTRNSRNSQSLEIGFTSNPYPRHGIASKSPPQQARRREPAPPSPWPPAHAARP